MAGSHVMWWPRPHRSVRAWCSGLEASATFAEVDNVTVLMSSLAGPGEAPAAKRARARLSE